MRKIIISGAGGFLGTVLIKRFLEETEYNVYALSSQYEKLVSLYGDVDKFHVVDQRGQTKKNYLYKDAIFINCAFPRNPDGKKMAEGLRYISNLLEESVSGGVGAVVNISSQSVYSQKRDEPADEETELNLESKYSVGKYAMELLTNTICRNLPHTNLRLSSMLGIGFEQRFVNKMVKQVVVGKSLYITGDMQEFSFLDVRDAAEAIVRLIESDMSTWDEIYNIGNSESYTLGDIAEKVVDIGENFIGKKMNIVSEGDVVWHNSSLNCSKFIGQFEWEPIFSIDNTIEYMFQQYVKGV